MKKVIRLTENDLEKIIERVLYEQTGVLNKVKSHPLWKKISNKWDGNVDTFGDAILKTFPRLDKNRIEKIKNDVSKMSSSQKLDLIKKNISNTQQIQEQSEGGFGPLYVLIGAFFAYVLYTNIETGMEKLNKKRIEKEKESEAEIQKRKEEEENKKRLEREAYLKLYGQIETLNGKTINVYLSPSEEKLVKQVKISNIEFHPRSKGSSYITFNDLGLAAVTYTIACMYNPSRFENRIVKSTKVSPKDDLMMKIVDRIDDPSYSTDFVYNKNFTEELNRRFSQFCKKPDADFSTIRKPLSSKRIS